MQVAIVSTDGINVDDHFGRAERFLIYEISVGYQTLMGIRIVTPFSDGDKSHDFNRRRFLAVVSLLTGCERVYCTKIGERPAAELNKLGIEPVIYEGPIEKITV